MSNNQAVYIDYVVYAHHVSHEPLLLYV